ncbi:MAG: universal stress protein [Bacteroidia bacterium]|nr:universal stress protein [Bacteroidia bacterium]
MVQLKIYGREDSSFGYLQQMIQRFAQKANLGVHIEVYNDVREIAMKNPEGIPFIEIDGQETIQLKTGQTASELYSEVRRKLLNIAGYGTLQNIVVPIDFSPASINALQYALDLYHGKEAVIHVIHCFQELVNDVNGVPYMDQYQIDNLNNRMEELIARYANDSRNEGLVIHGEVIIGSPLANIQRVAKEHDNTVMFMGSSGTTGVYKILIGSMTRAMLKKAVKPLFIIPPDEKYMPWHAVAWTVDRYKDDRKVFGSLKDIISEFNPTLHLLHAKTNDSDDFEFEILNDVHESFAQNLVKPHLLVGKNVAESIESYVSSHDIQLLVMSHYERGLFDSLFHHSVSKEVASHLEKPMLIINPKGCKCPDGDLCPGCHEKKEKKEMNMED